MADDVLLNKAAAIERSVRRAREEYDANAANLLANQTRQDAIILNLQRACESSIDAAMHIVRVRRLGIPQETREAFVLLEQANVIDAHLADRLKKMVGFRNVAVHDYQKLNLDIVRRIVVDHLDDMLRALPGAAAADAVGIVGDLATVIAAVEFGGDPPLPFSLGRAAAEDVFRTVATETSADRALNPGLPADAVDTIVAACCIVVALMRHLHLDQIDVGVRP